MRLRTVLREAWLNVAALPGNVLLLVAGLTVVLSASIVLDASTLRQLERSAMQHRSSGGATFVVGGGVDGRSCEQLGDATNVVAAAAVHEAGVITVTALPDFPVTHFEMTRSASQVLQAGAVGISGVLIDEALASELGLAPGSTLTTEDDRLLVAGVFRAAPDSVFQRSVVTLTPTAGSFESCLVSLWPPPNDEQPQSILQLALRSDNSSPTITQLNSGAPLAPRFWEQVENRSTRSIRWFALVSAAALTATFIRSRRLELATSMMAGVRRSSLTAIIALETLIAISASLVVSSPIAALQVSAASTVRSGIASQATAICVAVIAGGLAGAMLAVSSVRTHHLFRYFQDRR